MKTYVDRVTDKDTKAQLDFVRNTLEVPSGAAILDLACGYGRVSIPLAREGFLVTGFDYSEYLLNFARKEAEEANLSVSFVQGDMRNLVFEDEFDAIINLFTSFGYFETIEDDRAVLKGVHHALKRDGFFLLDFANTPRALGWL
jgi:2-polyprenyl-3-methyl-5-hydroxy-6-metoxy-1,4-benzoquinol methylase